MEAIVSQERRGDALSVRQGQAAVAEAWLDQLDVCEASADKAPANGAQA